MFIVTVTSETPYPINLSQLSVNKVKSSSVVFCPNNSPKQETKMTVSSRFSHFA